MYQFRSSASEEPNWLQQHTGRRFALDYGTNWPYGQPQAPDLRIHARETFPTYERSNATMQLAPAHWSDLGQTAQPEGFLSSSADSCQSIGFQSRHQVFSPVENRGFAVQSRHQMFSPVKDRGFAVQSHRGPQWQSPSHSRPYTVSAPACGTVHRQLSGHLLPILSQGTFCDVHHGVLLQGDPFTSDLFTKEDPLLQAFASTQTQAIRTVPPMGGERQFDFIPSDSNAFSAATQPFALACAPVSDGLISAAMCPDEKYKQTSAHGDVHQMAVGAQSAGKPQLCCSESSEHQGKTTPDLPTATHKVQVVSETSSAEVHGSNSDDYCGRTILPKTSGRKRTKIDHITVAYLEEHKCFDMPLAEAAKKLDVGLSVMKKVKGTLGLTRWPYRTRASLQNVIEKTRRYMVDNADTEEGETGSGQKANVIGALQSQMSSVTGQGGSDLNSAIKKYRQSIFKLNYKLKKCKSSPSARHKIAVPRNAAERVLADKI